MVNQITNHTFGVSTLTEEDLNIIEQVIEESELKLDDAIMIKDEDSDKLLSDTSVRSCKTGFLPPRDEIVQLFGKLIQDYNNNHSGWNYDLEFIEAVQLGHYYKGDFYDWHIDSFKDPRIRTKQEVNPDKPYNRKVSVTVWLNDPEEYEGGEFDLEIRGPNCEGERYETMKYDKGTIVVFPSHMWHRVRPVTSGVRKSLVLWIQGPPFK